LAVAIVGGAIANKPFNGGEAWVRLSWVLGLARLGFDTYFAEELATAGCVDEHGRPAPFAKSANRRYFDRVTRDFALDGRVSLLCDGGSQSAGLDRERLLEIASEAELLVNVSGHLRSPELLAGPRTRLYVDLDPGFTQSWHADPTVEFELRDHDHYATVGLAIGRPSCRIPDCGIDWIPTLPPVLLDRFPAQPPPPPGPVRFTTVASWRSPFGTVALDGESTSLKHHQFRRVVDLPRRARGASFEIALAIDAADARDLEALREHGWDIADPRHVASDPQGFREYVSASGAEFSVAQGVYVEGRSGWFSDRTAAYLASGRPALVQDTGVGDHVATGAGLLTFGDYEDAVAGVDRIATDYAAQSAAARAFAEAELDSDVVLTRLLTTIGIGG
jgi:hypothetical protein